MVTKLHHFIYRNLVSRHFLAKIFTCFGIDSPTFRLLIRFGLLVLALLLIAIQLPRIILGSPSMQSLISRHFVVRYEPEDRRPAIQLKTLLEDRGLEAADFLHFSIDNDWQMTVFIYPNQWAFQVHELGWLVNVNDRNWYVADHWGNTLLMVSPRAPGLVHTYQSCLSGGLQQFILSLVDQINGQTPLWLKMGISLYLGNSSRDDETECPLPPLEILQSSDPEFFTQQSGYQLADSFVAWIVCTYGSDAISRLVQTAGDYQTVLHEDPTELYINWWRWLQNGRVGDPRLLERQETVR